MLKSFSFYFIYPGRGWSIRNDHDIMPFIYISRLLIYFYLLVF